MKLTVAHQTKYPKIFAKTYWGGTFYESDSIDGPIVANRNKFVETFWIKKEFWPRGKGSGIINRFCGTAEDHFVDHVEGYLTEFGQFVMICSNYSSSPPSILGMHEYQDKLYSHTATTFIKIFQDLKTFREFMSAADIIFQINEREPDLEKWIRMVKFLKTGENSAE